MWKSLEERNLAIIEAVMLELGVSDIEELPAKAIELKAAAQHSAYPTDAIGTPVCRCNPVGGIHAAFCPCDRING